MENVPVVPPSRPNLSHGRISITEEAVIQNHSFLPSPRVSSSSDISEPDPASADAEAVGFHFPLDPALGSRGSMTAPMDYPNDPSLYPQSYDTQSRPVQVYQDNQFVYGDQMPTAASSVYSSHSHRHETYYTDNDHIPVDPCLTGNSTEKPLRAFTEHLNFFSLFPNAVAESVFANYVGTAQRSLNAAQDQSSSNLPPRPRGRPPKVPKISPSDPSRRVFTDAARSRLVSDISTQLSRDSVRDFPSAQVLHRYFVSFLSIFNAQLPIFHVPSLSIMETPCALLLSMCSIGALLQSDLDTANRLRSLADAVLRRASTETQRPLWEAQCILLSTIEAAFGGDGAGVRWAMGKLGVFRQEFAIRQIFLSAPHSSSDWPSWIERESTKRLLLGMYVVSSLLNLAYDLPPCMSTMDDLRIEMPASERVWMAPDAARWQQEMASDVDFHGFDIGQALTRLLYDKHFDPACGTRWSTFAVVVLIHALNVHLWHVSQSTQAFENFAIDPKMAEQMKNLCITQTEESFKRCYRILERCNDSLADSDGGLLFDGMAALRSCFVRVFTSSGSFNRAVLYRDDIRAMKQAAEEYVAGHQVRAPFVAKAVAKVMSDLLLTGANRLGPLSSLEHIQSVWDCGEYFLCIGPNGSSADILQPCSPQNGFIHWRRNNVPRNSTLPSKKLLTK